MFEANGVDIMTMGEDTDPSTLPDEVQTIFVNPPHLAAGMIQPFVVTATEGGDDSEA